MKLCGIYELEVGLKQTSCIACRADILGLEERICLGLPSILDRLVTIVPDFINTMSSLLLGHVVGSNMCIYVYVGVCDYI